MMLSQIHLIIYTRFPRVIIGPLAYHDAVHFNAWYLENVAVQSDRNT